MPRSSKTNRTSALIFWLATIYLFALIFAAWGFAVGRYEVFPFSLLKAPYYELHRFVKGTVDDDEKSLAHKLMYHRQEKKNAHPDPREFIVHDVGFSDDGYLLASRYSNQHGQVIVELIRLRDFDVLHTWVPPIQKILDRSVTDQNTNILSGYRAQHPLLFENGSVVFHSGEGALVKIDKCGRIVWLINRHFHHSIERMPNGNLLVPIITVPQIQKVPADFRDDGYAVVAPGGRILEVYSIAKILMDNGYRGLFLGVGKFEEDRIHLNDAEPITRDRGRARAGDVALSIRHLSTVLLYRPDTNKVIWLKTGPWLQQHDINILPNGDFSIFGNDSFRNMASNKRLPGSVSEVYFYHVESGETTIPYSKALRRHAVVTDTGGRAMVLENGDVFVEDSQANRVMRLSVSGARWEYVNLIKKKTTGAFHWVRYMSDAEIPSLQWIETSTRGQICD